jgi:hypothetical protein
MVLTFPLEGGYCPPRSISGKPVPRAALLAVIYGSWASGWITYGFSGRRQGRARPDGEVWIGPIFTWAMIYLPVTQTKKQNIEFLAYNTFLQSANHRLQWNTRGTIRIYHHIGPLSSILWALQFPDSMNKPNVTILSRINSIKTSRSDFTHKTAIIISHSWRNIYGNAYLSAVKMQLTIADID